MRAIDGDALEELFREVIGGIAKKTEMNGNLEHMVRASAMVIEMIQDAPTIEPQRKKGKWKMALTKDLIGFNTVCFHCSECNGMEYSTSPFCRVCGAKMEEGEANEGD